MLNIYLKIHKIIIFIMDILSNTNSKSIFQINNPLCGINFCYYVHEFLAGDKIYGTIIESNIKLYEDKILQKHNKKFTYNYCDQLTFDDYNNVIYDNDCCATDDVVDLCLIYKSVLNVKNYVPLRFSDLDILLKNGAKIYCDYMDQGFDLIEDFEHKYGSYELLVRDVIYCDNDGSDSCSYCAGEQPLIDLNDYNKFLNKNYSYNQYMTL